MNLLEKLEAEQAVGWPSPVDSVRVQRQRLREMLLLLATAYAESEPDPPFAWPTRPVDNPVDKKVAG